MKLLALALDERAIILGTLEDPPQRLAELRAVLLADHQWQQREGIDGRSGEARAVGGRSNVNTWITETTVGEQDAWFRGVLYPGGEVRSSLLGKFTEQRPSRAERDRAGKEREQQRREAEAEREKKPRVQLCDSGRDDADETMTAMNPRGH